MKKKSLSLIIAFALLLINSFSLLAERSYKGVTFTNIEGTVTNVINQKNLRRIVIKTDNGKVVSFNFSPNTSIYNYDRIQTNPFDGDRIIVSYASNAFMDETKNPPIYEAAGASIVPFTENKEMGYSAFIDYFDENLISSRGNKKIVFPENSICLDDMGKKISKEDVKNNLLLVLYSYTSSGFPQEIIPKRVIRLDNKEITPYIQTQMNHYFDELEEGKVFSDSNNTYVILSDVAQDLGYSLEWNGETSEIKITRPDVEFKIQAENFEYHVNGTIGYFASAPIIINGKTFVELSFAQRLFLNDFDGNVVN